MKTIIVLPSWGRDEFAYKKLLMTAPKNYKVYVLSYNYLCPHNNIVNIEKNILSFLQEKKVQSVILLGHSLGGAIAMSFTTHYPKLVSCLILISPRVIQVKTPLLAKWSMSGMFQTQFKIFSWQIVGLLPII